MSKVKSIQESIEKKARQRAEKEVVELCHKMKLLSDSKTGEKHFIQLKDDKKENLSSAFWSSGNHIMEELVEELTEKYIPEEVDRFVNDVERIKKDVDQLYEHSQSH